MCTAHFEHASNCARDLICSGKFGRGKHVLYLVIRQQAAQVNQKDYARHQLEGYATYSATKIEIKRTSEEFLKLVLGSLLKMMKRTLSTSNRTHKVCTRSKIVTPRY